MIGRFLQKVTLKYSKANYYSNEWNNIFIKYYSKLLNSRENTGFTTLKADLLDNKI